MLIKANNALVIRGFSLTGEELSEAIRTTMENLHIPDKHGLDIHGEGSDSDAAFGVPYSTPFMFIYADLERTGLPLYDSFEQFVIISGQDHEVMWKVVQDEQLDPRALDFAQMLEQVLERSVSHD